MSFKQHNKIVYKLIKELKFEEKATQSKHSSHPKDYLNPCQLFSLHIIFIITKKWYLFNINNNNNLNDNIPIKHPTNKK